LRCNVQASIKQFSCLSTVCSSFFLAYGIYESVMNKREIDDNFLYKIRLLCFVVPLTSALIPLFTRVYGSEIYSCYFLIPSGETQNIKVYVQSFLFFYGPLWLANIANIYFTVTVFKYFQKIEHFNELD
jgi:hypothetical protein